MGKQKFSSVFECYGALILVGINFFMFLFFLVCLEIVLKIFFPYYVAVAGYTSGGNAQLYGWGYPPHYVIHIKDPDTQQIYLSHTNNHGWRDEERSFKKLAGEKRILVLGDSITFGLIVPDTYTRILERKLRDRGNNVEVLNMAYAGWGTDQELEALKHEGIRYAPDWIVVQFCINDLEDNVFYKSSERRSTKPFYYELDKQGYLLRKNNPFFEKETVWARWKHGIMDILLQSEIFKRLYVFLFFGHEHKPHAKAVEAGLTSNQVAQLEDLLKLSANAEFIKTLRKQVGNPVDVDEIKKLIETYGLSKKSDIILRILETHWFHQEWAPDEYHRQAADPNAYEWRLYFALLSEIKKVADSIGAKMVVFVDTGESAYDWDLYWGRVSPDAEDKKNYLSHIKVIQDWTQSHGVDFIPNTRYYNRARNDPHETVAGNEAIADDMFDFFTSRLAHP
jgi:hypothetical protein